MSLHVPELPEGVDTLTAALADAKAGWYVLPVLRGSKDPGSVVGNRWQMKSSRDPEQIVAWFAGTNHGLALHAGRSGAVIFDVDAFERCPDVLREAITCSDVPFQATRKQSPRRGHYPFLMPFGRMLGNSKGKLTGGWGEVRGRNGVIIVQPSTHEKAAQGGQYLWKRVGPLPDLPQSLSEALSDGMDPQDTATDAEVSAFLQETVADPTTARSELLTGKLNGWRKKLDAGESRHDSLCGFLVGAMTEARAGLYNAADAVERFRELFVERATSDKPGDPKARKRNEREALGEFQGILSWAIGQALPADLDVVRERIARLDKERSADPFGDSSAVTAAPPPVVPVAPAIEPPVGEEPTTAPEAAQEAPQGATGLAETSWGPVDLTPYLDGSYKPAQPTLLPRSDGRALLYPGLVHSVHGESESGKSLVLQIEAARLVRSGRDVLFVDFESDAMSVTGRLTDFGASPEEVRKHFTYVRPQSALRATLDTVAWAQVLARPYELAVIDGVTDSLMLFSLKTKDNDDIAKWMRGLPRIIAERTGAAVVLVDHVTKDADGRGRFALGGQAKMAGLTGAAYTVEVLQPLGVGLVGRVSLRVGKDRPGQVRPHAGAWRKGDRTQEAAVVVVDSSDPEHPVVTVESPKTSVADAAGKVAVFRPTQLMERASLVIEGTPGLSGNEVVKLVGGKADAARIAVNQLAVEDYVRREAGARGAQLHYSQRPYRRALDPQDDEYAILGTGQASDRLLTGSGPYTGEPGTGHSPAPGTAGTQSGTGRSDDVIGPCATCSTPTKKYGDDGRKLCAHCHAA
jgi:hypothetical protein